MIAVGNIYDAQIGQVLDNWFLGVVADVFRDFDREVVAAQEAWLCRDHFNRKTSQFT